MATETNIVKHFDNMHATLAGVPVETRVIAAGRRGESSTPVTVLIASGKTYKLAPLIEAPEGLTYAHDVVLLARDVYSVHVAVSKESAENLTKEPLDGPLGYPVALQSSNGWFAVRRSPELDRFVSASKESRSRPVQISSALYDRIKDIARRTDRSIKDVSDEVIGNGLMVS